MLHQQNIYQKIESEVVIPFIPTLVDFADIQDYKKYLLIKNHHLQAIEKALKDKPDGYYSKKHLSVQGYQDKLVTEEQRITPYSIIKSGCDLFAIYKGVKSDKLLGKGAHGYVKLAQNLKTGEWYAFKIQNIEDKSDEHAHSRIKSLEREYNILKMQEDQTTAKPLPIRESLSKHKKQYQLLMKLSRGISLRKTLDHEMELANTLGFIPASIPSILRIQFAIEIINALNRLHQKNIFHRDVQPANIIMDMIQIIAEYVDFGLAAIAKNKVYIGNLEGSTIAYSPPLRSSLQKGEITNIEFNESTELYGAIITLADFFWLLEELPPKTEILNWKNQSYIKNELTDVEYNCNDVIKGEDNKKIILNSLRQLFYEATDWKSNQANHMDQKQVLTKLESIKQLYKEKYPQHAIVKVLAFDVNEYLQASITDQQIMVQELIDKADQVWFYDTSKQARDLCIYAKLKHELSRKLIVVGDKAFFDCAKLEEGATKYLRAKDIPCHFQILHLSKENKQKDEIKGNTNPLVMSESSKI